MRTQIQQNVDFMQQKKGCNSVGIQFIWPNPWLSVVATFNFNIELKNDSFDMKAQYQLVSGRQSWFDSFVDQPVLTRGGPQIGRLGYILQKQYLGLWLKLINDTYTCSKALPDVSRKAKRNFEKMF